MTSEPIPDHSAPLPDTDRQLRIEELLLEGLDHYFAGRYEQAITVWTRVAFLERGHGRALAYIDRARSAQAERHRQSEELIHAGIAAYHAGEFQAARDLLARAVDQDGPHEMALVFLQRLGRVESAARSQAEVATRHRGRPADESPVPATPTNWTLTIATSVVVASVVLFASLRMGSWLAEQPLAPALSASPAEEALRVADVSARQIVTAQDLVERGRLFEALSAIEAIRSTDRARPEADLMKAAIQRELLSRVPLLEPQGKVP